MLKMTDNFKIVKNKYKALAIISAIVLGVLCGVIVACALLLAFKLSEIELLWVYYLLIGVGVAACSAVPFFFLLRPNDNKLAKKLDKKYSLNQKVQTMVEYADAQGAMVTLQREQTNEALAIAAKSRPDGKALLKFIFIPVIAIAIACVSIIIPAKKTTVILPGFTLSENQRRAVNELIEDVNSSDMTDGLKLATTTALSDMLEKLEDTTLQSKMKSTVISTIKGIDIIIADTNSYLPMYKTLKDNEYTKSFAISVAQGVAYYKSINTVAIKSLDSVERQNESSYNYIVSVLGEWKDGVKDTFYHTEEGSTSAEMFTKQEMVERVNAYSNAFKEGLAKVEFGGQNDLLLTSVAAFSDDILTVDSNYGAESYLNAVYAICSSFVSPDVEDAVSTQTYSCLMDEFIRNRTAEIFGLKSSDIGSNSNVVPDIIDSGGSSGGGTSGGWGDGGIDLGSNDLVYDPDTNTFVEYGTLLARYRNKINERIAQFEAIANNPDATEEEKAEAKFVQGELVKYIQQYLDRLEGNVD
ncbi:MAG: hypothetical protein ACI4MN_05465 [Candidatus Coproplasma sp.]